MKSSKSNIFYFSLFVFLLTFHLYFSFYEDYEVFLDSFVNGIYTHRATEDFDFDIQFILLSIYSKLDSKINYNTYGSVLILSNTICLTYLYRYILININWGIEKGIFNKYILTFLLWIPLSIDQVLHLSSTRIAILGSGVLFLIYFNNKSLRLKQWIILIISTLILCLFRIDALLYTSIILLLSSIIFRKISYHNLVPLFISILVFLSYNTILTNTDREAKRVFYFQELDLLERNNINYQYLSEKERLSILVLKKYKIFDIQHFDYEYNKKIIKTNIHPFVNSLFSLENIKNTIKESIPNLIQSSIYIIFAILIISISIFKTQRFSKNIIILISSLLIALIPSLYIALPSRFLTPYYALLCIIVVIFYLKKIDKILWTIHLITVLAFAYHKLSIFYDEETQFKKNIQLLNNLSQEELVIDNPFIDVLFSKSASSNIRIDKNVKFLNFFIFNSFICYQSKWIEDCDCNALSLKEKFMYLHINEIPFISNDDRTKIYAQYFNELFDIKLYFFKTEFFNSNLNIYKIELKEDD